MVKVYIVIWAYDYEGYGEPQEAYSTREAAEDSIAQYSRKDDPSPEIFELEVDA